MRRSLLASAATALAVGGVLVPTTASPAAAASPPFKFSTVDYQVSASPNDLVLGNIDGRFGLDFVTVDGIGALSPKLNYGHRDVRGSSFADLGDARPHQGVAGDFNGDGLDDVAVVDPDHDRVLVVIAEDFSPLSSFVEPPLAFPVGDNPRYLAIGDFDQNAEPDLAVTNAGSDTVTILLGIAGDGFVREADIAVGDDPQGIVTLDADDDFDPDLAVVNSGAGDVSILVGNQIGGSFTLHDSAFGVEQGATAIDTGDFNDDGEADLAVADTDDDGVSLLYGVAGPNFAGRQSFATLGDRPADLVVADLNGDFDPDIAVLNRASNTLSISLGQPATGVFDLPQLFPTGPDPVAVVATDFDVNGLRDVGVLNRGNRTVRWYYQQARNAPSLVIGGPSAVPAGSTAELRAIWSDTDGLVESVDWDLDGDGSYEVIDGSFTVRTSPVPAGATTYRARVTDDDANRTEATITIRAGEAPIAALAASPDVVGTGQTVTLDASGSTDADSDTLHYRFDTDGNGSFETETREPIVTSAPLPFGSTTLRVRVIDDIGLTDDATVVVRGADQPVARLVAQPSSVLVGEGTTLDATGSGPAGLPLTYAFDLDGNGNYETPDDDGILAIPPYASAGVRTYGVVAVAPLGLTSTATATVDVRRVATSLVVRPILPNHLLGPLSATLTRTPGGQPVVGRTVTFTNRGGAVLCTAVTNGAGRAECRSLLPAILALLNLGYRATFTGDGAHLPSTGSAGLL